LWDWLSRQDSWEYKSNAKYEWPGWDKYDYMVNACPCCEYNRQHKEKYCFEGKCLLSGLWGYYHGQGCMQQNTPYVIFCESEDVKTKQQSARKIANHCKKLLREMK